ncbi:MAG: histidine kinase [Bacteroidetes bacterium]|jgi:ligand-binding sensor domain-containing protein|nr:histidine kinase [Bacteroidota bacterium]MBK8329736.1 histidine kinase [Bacteroidota bacterium]MBK9301715.1 histidine kinase [Bacteroidota bacterium]
MNQSISAFFNPQKLFIRNIHLKNGLSQCVVTDIIQDTKGFIWAGTFDGLNRFDGSNIKVFRHNPQDSNSIISSKIFSLVADENDHLYLFTTDGFCILDCKTEKIIRPSLIQTFKPSWVGSKDKNHIWYYCNNKGLLLVDTRDFSYQLMPNTVIEIKNDIGLLQLFEKNNLLYFVMRNGDIYLYDLNGHQMTHYANQYSKFSAFLSADIDKNGRIYLASNLEDLLYFNINDLSFNKTDLYTKNQKLIAINKVKYDSIHNVLWLSTYGQGLFIYEYQTGKLLQYKKSDEAFPISSNYLLSLCVNKYGVIYIAYDGMGIDMIDPFVKKFITVKKDAVDDQNTLKYVRKIVEDDDGNLLIGTSESGLVKLNKATNQLTFYNFKSSLTENRAFIIEMMRNGNDLWLGYNGSGVGIIDIKTLQVKKNILTGKNANQLSNGTIWSFLKDNNNAIWVGTRENGLNKVNEKGDQITQYDKASYPEFIENGIRCMYQFKPDELLLGTEKGLFVFDIAKAKIKKVFPLTDKESSFKSIKSVFTDVKKRFWLATDGGGIVILDKNYGILKNFNTNNGLNNNVVYGILPQNDSSFWISTNAGLCNICWNENNIYSNEPLKSQSYDELNGLQSNEFNTGAYTLLSNGDMVFGGLNGINIFNPKDITINPFKPKVYINEFKIFNNPLTSDVNITYLNQVYLNHYENAISISFNTLGFSMPEKTSYQYRLVGYDKGWIESKQRNYVSYTNLPPGHYEFQVKAANYDGVWNEVPTQLFIHIATPFYASWWFYVLIIASILLSIFLLYKYRLKLRDDKEKIKLQFTKELAEVEMKALRAQINPHFLFNSLNSINNYILKNDTKQASRYLVKFSQLVRNILNNSSSPYITLQEELKTIELYMLIEGMRFSNQFSYHIEIDKDLNTGVIYIPSLLLQPYVENAIWHGLLHKEGEKNILISIKKINEHAVSITIEDNGVGRKAAEEIEQKPNTRKSFGMQLGESRIRLLNHVNIQTAKVDVIDLYNDDHTPSGTKIDIVIPSKINTTESSTLN